MKNEPFVIERTYHAPVEKIWEAITDKDKMKQWYFDIADFRAEPGFEFSFTGTNEGRVYIHLCKILEVIPFKKLSYSWTYRDYKGYSVVSFELFPEGHITRLKLTHEGLDTFPQDSKDFARESFTAGWTYIAGISLKQYVEDEAQAAS